MELIKRQTTRLASRFVSTRKRDGENCLVSKIMCSENILTGLFSLMVGKLRRSMKFYRKLLNNRRKDKVTPSQSIKTEFATK